MTTKGPDYELQAAIVKALGANEELRSLIGSPARINPVRDKATWPGSYIDLGPSQDLDDSAAQLKASELYVTLHIWSRKDRNFDDAKRIAANVKNTLHEAEFQFTENTFKQIQFERSDAMIDPDGNTLHIAMTFRALTDNA